MNEQREQIEQAIQAELVRARDPNTGYPKHESIEESFVVLKREVDELWDACADYSHWIKTLKIMSLKICRNPWCDLGIKWTPEEIIKITAQKIKSIIQEAIQVAAMARRMIEDAGITRDITQRNRYNYKQVEFYLAKLAMMIGGLNTPLLERENRASYCRLIEFLVEEMLINTGLWDAKN